MCERRPPPRLEEGTQVGLYVSVLLIGSCKTDFGKPLSLEERDQAHKKRSGALSLSAT